jgi:hypothetical protein
VVTVTRSTFLTALGIKHQVSYRAASPISKAK